MFKFFPDSQNTTPPITESPTTPPLPSKQEIISDFHYKLVSKLNQTANSTTTITTLKDVNLKCINIAALTDLDLDKTVTDILRSSSDLRSGVYEGGFKTWECTFDLLDYINSNPVIIPPNHRVRVLDLGCGSGLLGLSVLKLPNHDVHVDFQDYNTSVLTHVTIPNTLLNTDDETALKCRYFSGDWSSFTESLDTEYDLILSSETIYNLDNFPKFIQVIKRSLRASGSLYLASKTFYFGVGGGTKSFLTLIQNDTDLEGQTVQIFSEGVKREIIRVQRKPRTKSTN